MNWYAIHTKPRQEETTVAALQPGGIETFYPRLRRRRLIRRKLQWRTRSLFPGYFFARFDVNQSYRLVRYAKGVASIVSFGTKPAIVDNAIIETIRQHADGDIVSIPPQKFSRGDLVQVQEGPLQGLQGIFEQDMNDSERVVVLLRIVTEYARVQVAREQLIKI